MLIQARLMMVIHLSGAPRYPRKTWRVCWDAIAMFGPVYSAKDEMKSDVRRRQNFGLAVVVPESVLQKHCSTNQNSQVTAGSRYSGGRTPPWGSLLVCWDVMRDLTGT